MEEEEVFENEGGFIPTICGRCGKIRPLWHDDLCLRCFLEVQNISKED